MIITGAVVYLPNGSISNYKVGEDEVTAIGNDETRNAVIIKYNDGTASVYVNIPHILRCEEEEEVEIELNK